MISRTMKYIKLYEELEGFEKVWEEDEPSRSDNNLYYKFLKMNNIIYLVEKYSKDKTIFYNNYIVKGNFMPELIEISNVDLKNIFRSIIPFVIYFNKDFEYCYFERLPKNIKNIVKKSYDIYESFDFEETWIDDESEKNIEIDLTNVKLGKSGPEFNVLDKVIIKNKYRSFNNQIGYVIDYDGDFSAYLIYFINNIGLSYTYNNIPRGHVWWVHYTELKKI